MSRKAKRPIQLPKGVQVTVDEGKITVKGPKGSLPCRLMAGIVVDVEETQLRVTLDPKSNIGSHFLGLFWSLIANQIKGVVEGFEKRLEMVGVGYRASVQGKKLGLLIGVSHPCEMTIPEGLEVAIEKSTVIVIKGIDKQLVGQFAADVRAKRPPEPYKGKGIRYVDEYIRRKAGKAGKAGKK